ncbi:unnamed protein product [Blepharisma stoltei]|uniref:Uncharacterized protein n=1 Tax=Blepharisma stoltei TaxID=1481888 RepID=A0AAU9JY46_9CILI|nr:unnamed protein product [Blepharisma stoltei]
MLNWIKKMKETTTSIVKSILKCSARTIPFFRCMKFLEEISNNFFGISRGHYTGGIGFNMEQSNMKKNVNDWWMVPIGQFTSESREFAILSFWTISILLNIYLIQVYSPYLKNFRKYPKKHLKPSAGN